MYVADVAEITTQAREEKTSRDIGQKQNIVNEKSRKNDR